MAWVQITCADRDALMADRDLVPISSCTDLDGQFHSEPEVFTEWGDRGTEQPVLRDRRFPPRYYADEDTWGKPDPKPCEHYRFQED